MSQRLALRSLLALAALACIVAARISWGGGSTLPTPGQSRDAIGSTAKLSPELQRAFDPRGPFFKPVPKPEPGDWLAEHQEDGQSFPAFTKAGFNKPDATRKILYFQPLGDFPKDRSPSLDHLKELAEASFGLSVKIQSPLPLEGHGFKTRKNQGVTQIRSTDVLRWLRKKLPADAYCILAITMTDLYPQESWNYVFGQASLINRVGVYSFARYDPGFWGEKRTKKTRVKMLRRSINVLVHETAHMFGLEHCIYYHCVVNGSNHLAESDAQPIHLCPVCLRKLQSANGFDIPGRYQKLQSVYEKVGFTEEAAWIKKRRAWIKTGQ